ncbi:hypothetical protein [Methyloceanibacter sp.]|uniref:hypothetical protein n=2 Tax=Methyloceanibacter sp. TaxID=1965321 RepID=UPI003C78E084
MSYSRLNYLCADGGEAPMKHKAIVKISTVLILSGSMAATLGSAVLAKSAVPLNDFYNPINLSEITPENMQSWPY